MIKKLFFFITFTICTLQGFANELDVPKRIQSLLPEDITLNIKPYIPSDFELVKSDLDPIEFYFWTANELLEKYLADLKSPHRPFIQIITPDCSQGNIDQLSAKEYVAGMKKYFPIHSSSLNWGNYEVTTVKMDMGDDEYMAFVNLNNEKGPFITFHLLYYKKLDYRSGNKPSKEDLVFWNDFLSKTK